MVMDVDTVALRVQYLSTVEQVNKRDSQKCNFFKA